MAIWSGLRKLGLESVYINDKVHLLCVVDRVRLLYGLPQFGECFSQCLKPRIYLISVPERDDVLAGRFNSNAFKPIPCEHAWSSHSVNAGSGYDVVASGRWDCPAGPRIEALRDWPVLDPALALQVCKVAMDLRGCKLMSFLQVGAEDADRDGRTRRLAPTTRCSLIPVVEIAKYDLPDPIGS